MSDALFRKGPVTRLELRGIGKSYAATRANDDISLSVTAGEIHSILGENGAGKSTLVKIIYGVVQPDQGEITWEGQPTQIPNPNAARALGIGMVFQHFSLFESLTVAENIALGLGARENLRRLATRIAETGRQYGLAVDPHRHVHHLSVGERQRVEIVRCLLQNPRLLIMDEPTSVLTPQEVEKMFAVLRRIADEGCSILYISHKLDEIQALCHRATVLRAGRVVGACDPSRETPKTLAELMVGAALPEPRRADTTREVAPVLELAGLSLASDDPFGTDLHDIALRVRPGEILGIAGVAGNGQTELLAAIAGERRAGAETMLLAGEPVGHLGAAERRRRGLAFIPEERIGRGAVGELSLAENGLLTAYQSGLAPGGIIRRQEVRRFADAVFKRFRVVAAGIDAEARSLSGGNMQKFIVGREVSQQPRVLLAAHPTWGVDIGAALSIRQELMDMAAAGAAVLVVSEDLSELFEICDRIAVLSDGHLTQPRERARTSLEEIGLLMGGANSAAGAREAAHGIPA